MTTSAQARAAKFPDALTRAVTAYRDICWRGGDPTAQRLALETEMENYATGLVLAALDKAMPARAGDDELVDWIDASIHIADQTSATYAADTSATDDVRRSESEYWAREARMFRLVRERLTAAVAP